jgi:DNA-binding PadR family transcriptional regulator
MVEQGLITEVEKRRTRDDDERRRYYRITAFGTTVARAEMARLTELLRLAKASGLTPRTA